MSENPTTDIVMTRKEGNSICPFVVSWETTAIEVFHYHQLKQYHQPKNLYSPSLHQIIS